MAHLAPSVPLREFVSGHKKPCCPTTRGPAIWAKTYSPDHRASSSPPFPSSYRGSKWVRLLFILISCGRLRITRITLSRVTDLDKGMAINLSSLIHTCPNLYFV